ncbi:MAG: PIN domain-containing protein [Anaerolineales bacterium]
MRSSEISAIERDPTDNRYLECAIAGEASYIVSGDRHLWEVGIQTDSDPQSHGLSP